MNDRPSPACCSGRSSRWTATPTSWPSTSTPRRPARRRPLRDRRQPGGQGPQQRRDPPVDLRPARHPPRPDPLAHRAAGPAGAAAVVRHLLQRLPGHLLAPLTVVTDVDPDRRGRGRGRHRDRLQVDGQRPLASAWTSATVEEEARAHASPSRCRSSRSSTAAGTGTTSSPATTTPSSRRPSGPPRSPPTAPSTAPSTSCITTMNRPDFVRQAARPARRRRGAPALPRHGHGDGPGQGQGHRLRVLPGRRDRPGRQAAGDRAGQPRRVRWLRPRPAREGPQGHRDLRDDDGRRRRLRARGHHPRGHLRRPGQAADDRRRPHVQPLQPLRAPLVRRDRAAVALLVADPPRRLQPVGLRRPQPALLALAAQARRRRLQRLVHVPDPAGRAGGGRPVAAGLHQVGRLRVRPARQGGRLPDGVLPGRRGLARAVDRQERRARLAVLLPPPQPVHRRPAALALRARRPDGAREPQPPDQAPRRRCSTPPRSCATWRWRTCCGARTPCTASSPRSWRRSTRSASSSPTPSCTPTATSCRRCAARSRRKKGKADIEIPGRKAHAAGCRPRAAAPAAPGARDGRGLPGDRADRDGRRLVQTSRSTTPRSSR